MLAFDSHPLPPRQKRNLPTAPGHFIRSLQAPDNFAYDFVRLLSRKVRLVLNSELLMLFRRNRDHILPIEPWCKVHYWSASTEKNRVDSPEACSITAMCGSSCSFAPIGTQDDRDGLTSAKDSSVTIIDHCITNDALSLSATELRKSILSDSGGSFRFLSCDNRLRLLLRALRMTCLLPKPLCEQHCWP